jgi:stress response protein YsnF
MNMPEMRYSNARTGQPMVDMFLNFQAQMLDGLRAVTQPNYVGRPIIDGYADQQSVGTTTMVAHRGERQTEQVIPLAEEFLNVEAQRVSGATIKVRRYVVETPVEQEVILHDEHVVVERRRVSGGSPADALSDKTVEATEISERAVVRKGVRVKEEIVLRLEKTERRETVRDSVRRDEVEIIKPRTAAHREVVSASNVSIEKKALSSNNGGNNAKQHG